MGNSSPGQIQGAKRDVPTSIDLEGEGIRGKASRHACQPYSNGLSFVLQRQRKYETATEMNRQALNRIEKALREEHRTHHRQYHS